MTAAAIEALHAGAVVGVPTDTVYGLAAHPDHPEAVERLYDLKGRDESRPIAMLVASVEQAVEMVSLDVRAWGLAVSHWPGPLTLVARASRSLPRRIGDRGRTVGVRMPDLDLMLDILEATGPLAVASANIDGQEPARSHLEAKEIFGADVDVYVEGDCPGAAASTVVDVTSTRLIVLRQGPIHIDL